MQLVDEGKVDLDEPVRTYLPGVPDRRRGRRGADHRAAAAQPHRGLRGRHLHRHRHRRRLRREVPRRPRTRCRSCSRAGEQFSYNNAGFCVLGRLVEVLREKPYDACLRERLFAPLGLTHAATGPYEAILFRAAMGHIELEPGTGYQPAPVWALARSNAPAGSMLAMRPRDLLDVRPDALERRQGRRRHAGARARAPPAGCTSAEVELPDLGLMGTRGASASSGSTPRAARSSATTAAPSARRRSCGWCPRPASPSPCSPTAATRSRSTATSSATSSRR